LDNGYLSVEVREFAEIDGRKQFAAFVDALLGTPNPSAE